MTASSILVAAVMLLQCSIPSPKANMDSLRIRREIAPAALMAGGAAIHFLAHDALEIPVADRAAQMRGTHDVITADGWLRFVPVALDLGLGLAGVEARHGFAERSISAVWTYGCFIAAGGLLKAVVDSPRPDGSDSRSFPSGHAGMAFAGAELMRMEYGWGWGAGAYALATGVCATRLYDGEHWLGDVIFGAGLGILCAHLGEWLTAPTMRILGRTPDLTISPAVDPRSGAICTSLALKF